MILKVWWALLAFAMIALLAGCGDNGEQSASTGEDQKPPTPAQVMEMARRDLSLDRSYSAKLRSKDEAVVIARVEGLLEARHFQAGDLVKKGDSLYTIEPALYQATVNQREADLQSTQAEAYRAQRDAARLEQLVKSNAISQQELDQAIATARVASAKVAQAEAAVESAEIDLGYSDVTAPVAGMISLSDVNVGNVVSPGTELATITPLNPLEVRFQLPQAEAFDLRRQRRRQQAEITAVLDFPGLEGTDAATLTGRLDFLGSSVDRETSTVQARAVFDNPDNLYLPGQFVRVQIKGMERYDILAVPQIALSQGLMGPQVFTLNKDNVASTTNVTPGEPLSGQLTIREGLEVGDRVIVSDPGGLEAGTTIDPQPVSSDPGTLSGQAGQSSEKNQGVQQSLNGDQGGGRLSDDIDAESTTSGDAGGGDE